MLIEGPMDGDVFLQYVQSVLCHALTPRHIVVLDNLGSHKADGVEQAIAAAAATVLYLTPYLPDPDPIEELFARLKALLRKTARRSPETLRKEIGTLLNSVSPEECMHYFQSSGYVHTKLNLL
jgi:transposase